MDADIKYGPEGFEVINPIRQPDSIVSALNEVRIAITEMKRLIKLTPEIGYIFEKRRKDVEQYDEKLPVDSKWVLLILAVATGSC